MSHKGVNGRGRYGNEVGNSLRNKRWGRKMSRGEVQSTSTLNDWARYVDRMNRQDLITVITGGVCA